MTGLNLKAKDINKSNKKAEAKASKKKNSQKKVKQKQKNIVELKREKKKTQ